jgi:PKD repeat protein
MILGSLLAGTPAKAQEPSPHFCGSDARLQQLIAANPELKEDIRRFIENNATVRKEGDQTRTIYKVPVVFHILHDYGTENITDAQVHSQMEILNEDYRKQNADLANVIAEFAGITGDVQIEFELATLDPWGNCTNGIEHLYSHLTYLGDDFSKINAWHRSKYLNVWVCKTFDDPTLGAYSFGPAAVQGGFFFADGVIILSNLVGNIGTAGPGGDHVLTHEIAHWLGLPHTWGNTNDPTIACGDDGIADTPITKGHDNCSNLYDSTCVPGVIENVQNFLEYSGCNFMFTQGQATFMQNTIQGETAQRNNLWTEENHLETGVNVTPPPTCKPVADFTSDKRMACVGDDIQFKDASWRAGVTEFAWTFTGGTPAASNMANPVVSYAQPGYYTVTLTVSNAAGSDTKTFTDMLYISGNWSEFTGPFLDDYESASANWWIVQNPEDNFGEFRLTPGVGKDLSKCYVLESYRDVSQADPYTADWFYPNRLGGSKDYLISPSYNLSNTTNVTVSFDYAYGTNTTDMDNVTEEVRVYSSRDCGKTWQPRMDATLNGTDLLTVGYVGDHAFVPANNNEWRTQTFTYNTTAQDTKTRFRFEFKASDFSNNLYIDNINITGTLGIEEADGTSAVISLSPNPVQSGGAIDVLVENGTETLYLELLDVNGALVSTTTIGAVNGTQTVQLSAPFAKGCYFLNAVRGDSRTTHRVIVF